MKFGKAKPFNAITHENSDLARSPHSWAALQVQECSSATAWAHSPCPELLFHQSRSLPGRDPKALYGSFYVTAALCEHPTSVTDKLSPAKPPWHVTSLLPSNQTHQTGGYKVLWDCAFPLRDSRSLMNLVGFQGILNRSSFMPSVLSVRD